MLISFTFNSYNILSIHYVHSKSFYPLIRTKTSRKKVRKICPPQHIYLTLRRSKERCRSGRSGRSRKPLYPYGYPGFESLSFRKKRFEIRHGFEPILYSEKGMRTQVGRYLVELSQQGGERSPCLSARIRCLSADFVIYDILELNI